MPVIGGNVVTREGVEALVEAGADMVKVGVGAGSICTTRIVAGAGMPQMTAIFECVAGGSPPAGPERPVPIIADGGVVTSGDIVKAFVAGADAVMLGQSVGRCRRGAGRSRTGRRRDVEDLPGHGLGRSHAGPSRRSLRHRAGRPQARGRRRRSSGSLRRALAELVSQLVGGLRSGMGYAGAATLDDLRHHTRLVRITGAGLRESHPHDVDVIRD